MALKTYTIFLAPHSLRVLFLGHLLFSASHPPNWLLQQHNIFQPKQRTVFTSSLGTPGNSQTNDFVHAMSSLVSSPHSMYPKSRHYSHPRSVLLFLSSSPRSPNSEQALPPNTLHFPLKHFFQKPYICSLSLLTNYTLHGKHTQFISSSFHT